MYVLSGGTCPNLPAQTTHEKVKRRALQLVAECTAEFEGKDELGIMEDLYNSLKAKSTS